MVMTWEWGGKEGEPSRTPRGGLCDWMLAVSSLRTGTQDEKLWR